jgi:hypothetical protein
MSDTEKNDDVPEKTFWLDSKKNLDKVFRILLGICALFAVADLVHPRHAHYEAIAFEAWPFFYCIFGFVIFALVVFTGKPLRKLLMRKEDYYDG